MDVLDHVQGDEINRYRLQFSLEKVEPPTKENKRPQISFVRLGSASQSDTNGDIDKRTRKITHRIAELFSLIKENQSER